ncbi:hypothetical protein B0T21DRAFT_342614 [Apiosordaria backusii]|uniref:Uncharacterized protein n=1 Tax=Apiosordaria backusii TaxID=314023 RepID=A0AA39ZQ17_9PEZI|nr:hypothetical protein B0T21DRAFT_342614 [Apiosordaria backusii]
MGTRIVLVGGEFAVFSGALHQQRVPFQHSFMNHWIQSTDLVAPDNSRWIMLAVARLDPNRQGPRYYPLAACSIHSSSFAVLTACTNALRIFSDPLNHFAMRFELALACSFYSQPWLDSSGTWTDCLDFPFIATCLAVGTTRDEDSTDHNMPQLPLAAVYHSFKRDCIDTGCGMVVIDITDPTNVRYGIRYELFNNIFSDRPTSPTLLCAADYIRACRFLEGPLKRPDGSDEALELTRRWEVIDVPTFTNTPTVGWPHNSSRNPFPPVTHPPQSLRDQVFLTLVRGTAEMESLDISVFEHVRSIPNFHNDLRRHLIKHSADMGVHQPTAQLIALALEGQEQLDLTPFQNLSADSISTILGSSSPDTTITSITLCVDTLKSSPSEVLQVLARFPTVQDLYLFDRRGQSSIKFFTEMLKTPSLIPKGHILVAGLLSAPLQWARVWHPIPPSYQIPFDLFPVQHMFVRHQVYGPDQEQYWPNYLSFGDLFLRPERFAVGFIRYLLRLVRPGSSGVEASEKLFDFCSAPPTLARMYEHYQISQIPRESSGIPLHPRTSRNRRDVGDCWPLVRTVKPGSWTVLVSLHHNHITRPVHRISTRTYHATNWARYAFVRTKTRIDVTQSPVNLPPLDELEVVSLKEFLKITSPETDPALVDLRLDELEEKAAIPRQAPLPDGVKRLSVMDHEEAMGILQDFLNNVEMVKKNLWAFMKETDAYAWYPELLEESNGQLNGSMVHGENDIFVDSVNAQLSLDWEDSDPEVPMRMPSEGEVRYLRG